MLTFGFHLAEDVPNDRIQKELTELVPDRRNGFSPEVLVISFNYKAANDGQEPEEFFSIRPYLATPEQEAAHKKLEHMRNAAAK